MNQVNIEENNKELTLWDTALIPPNIPQSGLDRINQLILYQILETVDYGRRITLTQAFAKCYESVDIEEIIKSWGSGNEETFSQTDHLMVNLKHMTAVVTKYLTELGAKANEKKISDLARDADLWLHRICVSNGFRMQELEKDR